MRSSRFNSFNIRPRRSRSSRLNSRLNCLFATRSQPVDLTRMETETLSDEEMDQMNPLSFDFFASPLSSGLFLFFVDPFPDFALFRLVFTSGT